MIHTDQSAGYDLDVVKNSWTGEELFINPDLQNSLKFRGWIKESNLRKLMDVNKINLDKLYDGSLSKDFCPRELGFE